MLVLSRQLGETILIGDDIEIQVVGIVAGKVKLGISAPRSVNIKRKELLDRVIAENRASTGVNPGDLPGRRPTDPPPISPSGS